jgi:HK97 gp10 family phage protein
MADIIFRSNRAEMEKAVKEAIDIGMEAVAKEAEGNAIREVTALVYDSPPSATYVRTGALRNSIGSEYVEAEKAAYVGAAIEYAPYVEFGTRHMHERPFLRNAINNYTDSYKAILEDALKNLE